MQIDSLVHYDSASGSLNGALGYDVSGFDPEGPLPPITGTDAGESTRERVVRLAHDDKRAIRQYRKKAGSYAGLAFVGTPESIAEKVEQWLGCGGYGCELLFPSAAARLGCLRRRRDPRGGRSLALPAFPSYVPNAPQRRAPGSVTR